MPATSGGGDTASSRSLTDAGAAVACTRRHRRHCRAAVNGDLAARAARIDGGVSAAGGVEEQCDDEQTTRLSALSATSPHTSSLTTHSSQLMRMRQALRSLASKQLPGGEGGGETGAVRRQQRRPRKLSHAAQLKQTQLLGVVDLQTADSILTHVQLKNLLNRATFARLPPVYQLQLASLLPDVDERSCTSTGDVTGGGCATASSKTVRLSSACLNNEFVTRACVQWQDRLRRGELSADNGGKLKTELESRKRRLDPWKARNFEPVWGRRVRRCGSTAARDAWAALNMPLPPACDLADGEATRGGRTKRSWQPLTDSQSDNTAANTTQTPQQDARATPEPSLSQVDSRDECSSGPDCHASSTPPRAESCSIESPSRGAAEPTSSPSDTPCVLPDKTTSGGDVATVECDEIIMDACSADGHSVSEDDASSLSAPLSSSRTGTCVAGSDSTGADDVLASDRAAEVTCSTQAVSTPVVSAAQKSAPLLESSSQVVGHQYPSCVSPVLARQQEYDDQCSDVPGNIPAASSLSPALQHVDTAMLHQSSRDTEVTDEHCDDVSQALGSQAAVHVNDDVLSGGETVEFHPQLECSQQEPYRDMTADCLNGPCCASPQSTTSLSHELDSSLLTVASCSTGVADDVDVSLLLDASDNQPASDAFERSLSDVHRPPSSHSHTVDSALRYPALHYTQQSPHYSGSEARVLAVEGSEASSSAARPLVETAGDCAASGITSCPARLSAPAAVTAVTSLVSVARAPTTTVVIANTASLSGGNVTLSLHSRVATAGTSSAHLLPPVTQQHQQTLSVAATCSAAATGSFRIVPMTAVKSSLPPRPPPLVGRTLSVSGGAVTRALVVAAGDSSTDTGSVETGGQYRPAPLMSSSHSQQQQHVMVVARAPRIKPRTQATRVRNTRPPTGSVNLERSYQICQAVIAKSQNRMQLQARMKPLPRLLAENRCESASSVTASSATLTDTATVSGTARLSASPVCASSDESVSVGAWPSGATNYQPSTVSTGKYSQLGCEVKVSVSDGAASSVVTRRAATAPASSCGLPSDVLVLGEVTDNGTLLLRRDLLVRGRQKVYQMRDANGKTVLVVRPPADSQYSSVGAGGEQRSCNSAPPARLLAPSGIAVETARPSSADGGGDVAASHQQQQKPARLVMMVGGGSQHVAGRRQTAAREMEQGGATCSLKHWQTASAGSQSVTQQLPGVSSLTQHQHQQQQTVLGSTSGGGDSLHCSCKLKALVVCQQCGAYCHDDCVYSDGARSPMCTTCLACR